MNLGEKVSSKPINQSQEYIFIAVRLDIHDVIDTGPHLFPDVGMKKLLNTGCRVVSFWREFFSWEQMSIVTMIVVHSLVIMMFA